MHFKVAVLLSRSLAERISELQASDQMLIWQRLSYKGEG